MHPETQNSISTRRNILLGLGATALSTVWLPGKAHAATEKNVSYGPNRLDIYAHRGASNAPVLIYVHGGAWKAGNKRNVGSKVRHYNQKGFVVVSVGYTLYPSANAEQQASQIARAVNWVKQNISRYGGNGSRVALMGHSAGCHLSALATLSGACTPNMLVCNDTGAYDVAYLAEINNGRVPSLYSALDRKEKWTRWSPIAYVRNRRQPPTLVMWSGGRNRDRISKRFADALSGAGTSVTRFDGRRYNHLSINSAIGRGGNSVTQAVDRFLARL